VKRKLLIYAIATLLATGAQAATGPSGLGIAAVVGGEAITSYDVDARLRFVMMTAKLSSAADIRPQIIRSLIDERLQLKEAENNKISVTDEDVEQAIAGIEKQRSMPPGAIYKMLQQNRVPKDTFVNQIRAQLTWSKLLTKKIRPTVKITDEEIKLAQKRLSIPAVKQELEIAVLTLPVDKPQREGEVRTLALKLSNELRGGASFEELSRQFSSSAATSGGKVLTFWVRPEQLHPVVGQALASAKAGFITPPLRSPDGYTIVKVYNTRAINSNDKTDEEVGLKEILLKLKPDAANKEAETLLAISEEVAKNPGACEEKGIAGVKNMDDLDISVELNKVRLSELTPAVRTIVNTLKVGDISSPFATEDGIRLYMLCSRAAAPVLALDTDRVREVLFREKMELEAQKYLRNLRRDAYVEVR